jgi:hypothetical protein
MLLCMISIKFSSKLFLYSIEFWNCSDTAGHFCALDIRYTVIVR